jgi:cell division protein FtsB
MESHRDHLYKTDHPFGLCEAVYQAQATIDTAPARSLGSSSMSSLRQAPLIGRRALVVVLALVLVGGLVVVFSGSLTRSTDTESRAEAARAQVEAQQIELEQTEAEQAFMQTEEFVLWQARANGFGKPGEVRFALPDDAPPPEPITPIGPQAASEPLAPFDAWMELLFGA